MADTTRTLRSFERSLRAGNRSARTVQSYREAAELLIRFAGKDLEEITKADVQDFIDDQLTRHKPSSAAVRYRSLRRLFRWMVDEEIIERSPMQGMHEPTVPRQPIPVLSEGDLKRLLKATEGKGFEQRRDTAIILLFLDTGVRLGEMAGIRIDDIDDVHDVIFVTGKGSRSRAVHFGNKAGTALDRYLRERDRHSLAHLPGLWLGNRGQAVTESGISQMLKRRGAEAGVEGLHPHRFRHTAAHLWLKAGGSEGDLMELAGWRSRTMLDRYGASARGERARESHRKLSPADRL